MVIERDEGLTVSVGRGHAWTVVGDTARTRAWNLGISRDERSGVPFPGRRVVR